MPKARRSFRAMLLDEYGKMLTDAWGSSASKARHHLWVKLNKGTT
jgi:hypothetical protein